MSEPMNIVQLMREKAEAVAATVVELKGIKEAYEYALEICEKKEACQLLLAGCGEKLSEKGEALCENKPAKIIAAPNLDDKEYAAFSKLCAKRGITCIRDGLRSHLGGIDIGFTHVDMGIAETGTCVLNSNSENLRLASMISEIHVVVLPKSKVVASSYEAEAKLAELMSAGTPHYTAFISGPSRTADIERVLALGVHGPLELHLILVEG